MAHVAPILSDSQHGFVPRKSCDTNLACLLKTAWDSIQCRQQTDVIYTDYSSAFQSVNHHLVIHKLQKSYNVSENALSWLSTFLRNRRQRVIVNGKASDWTPVRSGTPEGSLGSPLLFALYVNDLPDKIKSGILLFADDVKLYRKITCKEDTKILQADLQELTRWSETWLLNLNPSKCHSFRISLNSTNIVQATYSIRDIPLRNVDKVRDLGVWLDTKLTFADHIYFTVRKANRMLGLLIRSLQTGSVARGLDTGPILAAYFANVRSVLEYGCVVWGGAAKTHLDRLDRVQHKFLIWLAAHSDTNQASGSLSYHPLLKRFKISNLAQRRLQYDVCFIHKVLSGQTNSAFLLESIPFNVPQRRTRAAQFQLLHVPSARDARVETVRRGLFGRAVKAYNDYLAKSPLVDPFRATYHAFRAGVVKHFKQNPF